LTAAARGRYTVSVTRDAPAASELLRADERTRRILDAAVQLAEAGGFAAVRLRDVAQTSGVALGTVYKRFRSKEDLLLGVLTQELHELRTQIGDAPILGATPLLRVIGFFGFLTDFLCRRPNLARAVVRSAASGEQALSERLASFHAKLFELSFAALQGGAYRAPTAGEAVMLSALQQVWFSALCGWAGSLYDRAEVVKQVAAAARLMTFGVDHMPAELTATASPLRVVVRGGAAASRAERGPLAGVEFVAAGEESLAQLLARDDVDVLELVAASAEIEAWPLPDTRVATSSGRPRIVVLTRGCSPELAQRLAQVVDVVLGLGQELAASSVRGYSDALYTALARGASLQDAHEEAREAIGADGVGTACVPRGGAELRALSLR